MAVLKYRDPITGLWQPLSAAGPPGPTAVSADPGNASVISPNDGLIYTPTVGGADFIDELQDVDTSTVAPTGGQVLTWDPVTGNWVPGTPVPGGARYLDELLDVDTTTLAPIAGDHLSFDGIGWTPYKNAIQATAPPAPRPGQLWLVQ